MADSAAPAASEPAYLSLPDGATIAYRAVKGKPPGVVFLGGLMSDSTGTKATTLDAHCRARGRAYVRFDYSGHGASSGRFVDGTIGRWAEEAIAVLDRLTEGPQIVVGSSMGGWLMLLAALARPERVHGLIGMAAAPDFTETLMWETFDDETRERLAREGLLHLPSDYGDEPYPITLELIEEGRRHLLLRRPIAILCPVHLLHGMEDSDVPWRIAPTLSDALASAEVVVTLIKDGDHRLSRKADLERLCAAVDEMAARPMPDAAST